jgi:hypothetical protein
MIGAGYRNGKTLTTKVTKEHKGKTNRLRKVETGSWTFPLSAIGEVLSIAR